MKFATKFNHELEISIEENGMIFQSLIDMPLQLISGRIVATLPVNWDNEASDYCNNYVDVTSMFQDLGLTCNGGTIGQSKSAILARVLTTHTTK